MVKKSKMKKGRVRQSRVSKARDFKDAVDCSLTFFPNGRVTSFEPKVRLVTPKEGVDAAPLAADDMSLLQPPPITRQYKVGDVRCKVAGFRDSLLATLREHLIEIGSLDLELVHNTIQYIATTLNISDKYNERPMLLGADAKLYENWLKVTIKEIINIDETTRINEVGKTTDVIRNPIESKAIRSSIERAECLEVAPKQATLADYIPTSPGF